MQYGWRNNRHLVAVFYRALTMEDLETIRANLIIDGFHVYNFYLGLESGNDIFNVRMPGAEGRLFGVPTLVVDDSFLSDDIRRVEVLYGEEARDSITDEDTQTPGSEGREPDEDPREFVAESRRIRPDRRHTYKGREVQPSSVHIVCVGGQVTGRERYGNPVASPERMVEGWLGDRGSFYYGGS